MSDEMYGDPQQQASYWEAQSYPEDCVEMSSADVVGQLTGAEPTEQSITTLALDTPSDSHSGDVYSPSSGTNLADAQDLLTHYGVQSQYYNDEDPSASPSGLSVLEKALADGGRPIVAVDGTKIWDAIGYDGGPDANQANHAVVVTGVNTGTGTVYLNDSGAPNGRDEAVPIATFMAAWATSGHSMVVADEKGATPISTHGQTDNPFVPRGEESQRTVAVETKEGPISREDEIDAALVALGVVGATMGALHRRRRGAAQVASYPRVPPAPPAPPGVPLSR